MALLVDEPFEETSLRNRDTRHDMLSQKLRLCAWITAGKAKIIDRDDPGPPVELVPRVGQTALLASWLEQAHQGVPLRTIIPKHRRHGVSTICQADKVFTILTEPNRECVTVAQKGEAAKSIFRIAKIMYKEAKRPRGTIGEYEHEDVTSHAIFNPDTGSRYECMSAMGQFTGSGSTIHSLHISEAAKLENASEQDATAMESLENAVSQTSPGTQIDIESSGQGPFGIFPDRCRQAADGKGMFTLVFISWLQDPALTIDEDDLSDEFDPPLAGDEVVLRDIHHATEGQLAWRRRVLDTKFRGVPYDETPARFKWDFPTVLEDCFSYQEGRIYPDFSRQRQNGKLDARFFGKKAYKTRFIDWGGSQQHPFVCLWCWIDPEKPPRLIVDVDACPQFCDQMIAYRRNPKTHAPVKMADDGCDALRYGVATLNLACLVYVYRELYIREPTEAVHTRVARKIHQMSGWIHPSGQPNHPDISLYRPVSGADEFKALQAADDRFNWSSVWPDADPIFQAALRMGAGVADSAQYRNCLEFTKWGIPLIPALKPKQSTNQGSVEDGIAMVQVLVMGDTDISRRETALEKIKRLAFSGKEKLRDGYMPDDDECEAMKRVFGGQIGQYSPGGDRIERGGSAWESIACQPSSPSSS